MALATLAVACGDLTRPKATTPNLAAELLGLRADRNASGATNAINFFVGPARVDAAFSFDVAFDLDPTGKISVYPVRALAGPLAGSVPTRVGLQTVRAPSSPYAAAPDRGYDTIGVKTITPGTVVAVELVSQTSLACVYSLNGSSMYAKFVVDSINLPTRRLYLRTSLDANCGFRSLVPDSIPTF